MKDYIKIVKKTPVAIKRFLFHGILPTRIQRWVWRYFLSSVDINGASIKYRAMTSDMYVIEDIFNRNEYHLNSLGLPEDAVIMDIGAHIGAFTIAATQIAPDGRVLAFEPMPSNYKVLKKNVKTNNLEQVAIFPLAISGQDGQVRLYVNENNTAGHSMTSMTSGKYHSVPSITLTKAIQDNRIRRIDLLKMDCEGAEYDILFNTPESTLRLIDKIIMEYHGSSDFQASSLADFLISFGFSVTIVKEYDHKRGLAEIMRI